MSILRNFSRSKTLSGRTKNLKMIQNSKKETPKKEAPKFNTFKIQPVDTHFNHCCSHSIILKRLNTAKT